MEKSDSSTKKRESYYEYLENVENLKSSNWWIGVSSFFLLAGILTKGFLVVVGITGLMISIFCRYKFKAALKKGS